MEKVQEHISKRVKMELQGRLISIIETFKEMDCDECVTFSSFYDIETGQTYAGVTMICDNEENRSKLENNNQILAYVDDIEIILGFTAREEILNGRAKHFKLVEKIVVDKKDYKELQSNMEDFDDSYCNLVDFQPPLSLSLKNTR